MVAVYPSGDEESFTQMIFACSADTV